MEESYEIEFEENLANGITSYKCLICGESFHDTQLLVDHHYATHINSSKKDEIVNKDVIFVNSENQIVDEHVQRFVYKCRLCTNEVSKLDDMTNHIDVEHNREAFVTIGGERMCTSVHKCVACSSEFASKPEMNQHFSSVHEFHRCNICSDYFPKDDLCHHKLSVHNTKPKMSYIQLIAEALLTSPDRMLALKDIYTVINKKHPYYSLDETFGKVQWQNCIRHNLTLHKGFIKMDNLVNKDPMIKGAPRGALWRLATGAEEGIFKRMAFEPRVNNHTTYKCLKCNGVFKSETSLKSHMCKNFGESFHCLQCNESFHSKFQLSTHCEVFHKSILLQREIEGLCTMESSTQSSFPHLEVENYLEKNIILDSQIQSQGSLNENLQANQMTSFEKLKKEKRETLKGRVNVGEKVYFDLPYGWTKEVVTRRDQPSLKGRVRKDVYLISPGAKGKKFRTDNELHRFLGKNPNILCDLEVTSTKMSKHRELFVKEIKETETMQEQHMRSICPEVRFSDQENVVISESKVPISDLVNMEEVIIDADYTDLTNFTEITNFTDLNGAIQIDQVVDSERIWLQADQNSSPN